MGILPILKNAKKKFRAVLRPKMLNFQIWLLYYLNAQGRSLSVKSRKSLQPNFFFNLFLLFRSKSKRVTKLCTSSTSTCFLSLNDFTEKEPFFAKTSHFIEKGSFSHKLMTWCLQCTVPGTSIMRWCGVSIRLYISHRWFQFYYFFFKI